ncbi:NAD(P)/FAD-dependent oxidoreductase [Rathayibacter soli]|uniref:NAD(P)/FAD-dependent oxidoreductase n=1 Tax=Rathayibacter soli TaxID=3144168 RepID=UPI0027E547BE|nr:FAD-dependent oxidoreductase [Glaciibacter superstes]
MASDNYRTVSFWFDSLAARDSDELRPRSALMSETTADVCIIGAGLTGLWTAYYLAHAHPELSIVVLEKEIAGFGASGRNGGWSSALFPVSTTGLARLHGIEAAVRMRQAMIDTVDEIGRVVAREQLDCDFVKGGTVAFVRNRPGLDAAREEVAEARRFGVDHVTLWGTDALRRRAPSVTASAATFTPDCARIQPAALARGLARVVESLGVRIYEHTRVTDFGPGRVDALGDGPVSVRAGAIVNATEAYGSALPSVGRSVMPLYSLMIATEPLPESFWEGTGIEHGQTFTDYRHLLIYGQRTADNRFAFGGRGARYHWGSAIRPGYDTATNVAHHLRHALVELFPEAHSARITHRWGGPLGVPRDWHASVGFAPDTRIGWAGGYVGDGVSTTNLAGRTLADLITATDSALTSLPWVNHRSPRWEPEPLRFLGANAGLLGMTVADAEERLTRRASVTARLMAPLIGH